MKNYHEFKGYSYRLDFDPVSKSFVATRLEPVMPAQDPPVPPAEVAEVTDLQVAKLRKKARSLQSARSPKAMRSRTCISFRKILPR